MELIVILSLSLFIIVLLAVLVGFNIKNLKYIKSIGENTELNELTNSLQENKVICKEMLEMINNKKVNIKMADENSKSSLYIVATNSIIIANIKDSYTRVQTIAHECLHSIQDKKMLWFNFIFSNIYLLYFIITVVLTIFKVITNVNLYAIILIIMSMILFFVRSYLEMDAMTKARFLAKEYMEQNEKSISKESINVIIDNYDKLNDLGIKYTLFNLMSSYLIKICIYCIIGIANLMM